MAKFFKRMFTWWNGATLGTLLQIRKHGKKVGEDDYGNTYYQSSDKVGYEGRPRRWVVYEGYADASRVPPEWHGWLHHSYDDLPEDLPKAHDWELPHHPNLTGTVHAYAPKGSLTHGAAASKRAADYEAWLPDA